MKTALSKPADLIQNCSFKNNHYAQDPHPQKCEASVQ